MSARFFIINTNELRYYGSLLPFVFGECCGGHNWFTEPGRCWRRAAENSKNANYLKYNFESNVVITNL